MAMYEFARSPHYADQAREELRRVTDKASNLSFDDLPKLEFLTAFLKECLRMYPPAVGPMARVAKVDHQIGNIHVKRGTVVNISIIGLLYNPKFYENPNVFDPSRWRDESRKPNDTYAYIPFSAGPRNCIG